MSVYLHPIVTAVPENAYPQAHTGANQKRLVARGDRKVERILHYLYTHSGIETRYSAIPDFLPNASEGLYYNPQTDTLKVPTTGQRNQLYTETTRAIAPPLARRALEQSGYAPAEITHVITVSCTGFFQPGVDYHIVRALGLPTTTQRFHLGFMGCYAAFPALKLAKTFCEADANAVVLVLCHELCSLHLQYDTSMDSLLGASVFADGSAAAVVSTRTPEGRGFQLERFNSTLTPQGEADMAWTIGDNGFIMRLSTYVPEILENNVADIVTPVLEAANLPKESIGHWAVHPGGRAILDKVQSALDLCDGSLAASRRILRDYGNMSSATILFVLRELQSHQNPEPEVPILAMAFGPGLTVESAVLRGVTP